ncbi:MAG: tyrosine--tRNA ligase, partial [Phycisphaerales bacterium JB039]
QRAGHTPVVVMGGGTGLIGDPSGKTAERQLLDEPAVARNVEAQRPIFQALLDLDPAKPNAALLRNNLDWLGQLSYIEALRDIGKHFSVNMMIQKDSVRERLHAREHGISYTEFSYMILQSYDFLHLFEHDGVTIQCGGSDQWGNIVAGADLIRRRTIVEGAEHVHGLAMQEHLELEAGKWTRLTGEKTRAAAEELVGPRVFAFTAPLVTKSDGGKFGKTESGAIWLTAHRTSPYAYYQFWLNAADADVGRYLRIFTFLRRDEIESLEQAHAANPGAREAQRTLAREATTLLHGKPATEHAESAARALFSGDVAHLDEATLRDVFAEVPSSDHDAGARAGEGRDLVTVLRDSGVATSNREARELLASGSISVNGRKVGPEDRLTAADLLHGSLIAIRRGKKTWRLTRWN